MNVGAPTDTTAEKIKVKVKLRVDQNGCFSVSSASMIETLPPAEVNEEPMETSETNTPVENGGSENKENQKDDKMEEDEEQKGGAQDETKVFSLIFGKKMC